MIKEIENYIVENVEKIENGEIESFDLFIELKHLESLVKHAKEQLTDYVLDDLKGESKELNGFKIEHLKGRKNWSFNHLDEWKNLKATLKDIEKRAKTAYENTIVDDETGEVIEAARLSFSKDSVKVTKLKN